MIRTFVTKLFVLAFTLYFLSLILISCFPERVQITHEWLEVSRIDTLNDHCRVVWKNEYGVEFEDWFVQMPHPFFVGQRMIVLLKR